MKKGYLKDFTVEELHRELQRRTDECRIGDMYTREHFNEAFAEKNSEGDYESHEDFIEAQADAWREFDPFPYIDGWTDQFSALDEYFEQ